MVLQGDYDALIGELEAIEKRLEQEVRDGKRSRPEGHRHYLCDPNIDAENVPLDEDDPEYWSHMYGAAACAAGMRAEGYGLNINTLIGYVIY